MLYILSGQDDFSLCQSLEKIKKDTDRDYFMSAEEAKEYGLVDEVIIVKKK